MVDAAMSSMHPRRVALGASLGVVLLALSARHASAQDVLIAPIPLVSNPLATTAITAPDPLITLPSIDFFNGPDGAGVATPSSKRPAALIPLYASFASLQVFDVTSTLQAIDRGAYEANPVVAPFVKSPPALAAMKAGSTVAVIYLTERLRKRHRIAAVLLMVGLNAGYVGVVTHNYSVSRR
jgi:Domain of unknown function (DUF5658)